MTKQTSKQQPDIQQAMVFESKDVQIDENLNQPNLSEVFPATAVHHEDIVESINSFEDNNEGGTEEDKPPASSKKWIWLGVTVLVLSLLEIGVWTEQVFSESDWLGGAWLLVLLAGVFFTVKACVYEVKSLRQLKQAESNRTHTTELLNSHSIGQGKSLCELFKPQFGATYPTQVTLWEQAIQPHHVDKEVLQLFEVNVLSVADQQALSIVTKHASASAAMIAVSPFALLDMTIVLWRNLVMLKQVSQCYGLSLSYWGRITLIKRVFKTMLLAGAAEIISDAGNYALSAGVTGKLSTRIAQGLGVGVMTTRIGIRAMQNCRPMPWTAIEKPGVSQLTQQLLSDLKKLTTSA